MDNTEQIQVQTITDASSDSLITGFFAIGMVINILLVTAYLVWACKQWGKKEKQDQ